MRLILIVLSLALFFLSIVVGLVGNFYWNYIPRLSAEGECAMQAEIRTYDASSSACMARFEAAQALKHGTGSSREEVERLRQELVVANDANQVCLSIVLPFERARKAQINRNREFAAKCFTASKTLAIVGPAGVLACLLLALRDESDE